MIMDQNRLFLVVGATGTQGGATARSLLEAGRRVRALVRDPQSDKALKLRELGAELARGDLDVPDTILAALDGVHGVFSVQRPDDGSDSERRQGFGLIEAAAKAGVDHIVHSSVCQVDEHADFAGWKEGRWDRKYWTDKWEVEEAVRKAGFAHWTILRPSFILQNLLPPKVNVLYPQLGDGELLTPIHADAAVQLIAGEDIGRFACAAFLDPEDFNRETIELAAETMTVGEIADTLAKTLDTDVRANSVGPNEALAAGQPAKWVRSQEWINEVGYNIDTSLLATYGVPLTPLSEWAEQHAQEFAIRPPVM